MHTWVCFGYQVAISNRSHSSHRPPEPVNDTRMFRIFVIKPRITLGTISSHHEIQLHYFFNCRLMRRSEVDSFGEVAHRRKDHNAENEEEDKQEELAGANVQSMEEDF